MKTKILELLKENMPDNEFQLKELQDTKNNGRAGFLVYSKEKVDDNCDIVKSYKNYTDKITETNLFRYYYYQNIKDKKYNGEHLTVVMMNPAFADSNDDDFTIKNILKYLADKAQYGSFDIINLYPVRMPKGVTLDDLNKKINKYFPDVNDNYQKFVISYLKTFKNGKKIAAWGSKYHKTATKLFENENIKFYCYGKNRDGSPRHFSNQAFIKEDNFLDDFKEYKF